MVAVAAAVQHALGVVDLAVPDQVDGRLRRGVSHGGLPGRRRGGRQGVDDGLDGGGRRGPTTGTTPHTPTAAGRRRGRASRGRRRRTPRCPGAARRRSRGPGPSVKNTENIVPADCTAWGTPASDSALSAASLIASPAAVRGRTRRRSPGAGWPGRRSRRSGSRRACRPGRPARSATSIAITSARPPNAAAGKPPPITLPNVIRSGVQPSRAPSRPHCPRGEARKPGHHLVADEQRAVVGTGRREELVEAGLGRDHTHVAGAASVMTQAIRSPSLGEEARHGVAVVVGQQPGQAVAVSGTPGVPGTASVVRPSRPTPGGRRHVRGSSRRTSPRRLAR